MTVIFAGGHVFLAMGALFTGIFGAFGILAGKMSFELNEHGLSRNFRPFLLRFFRLPELQQHFQFSDILSFQREKDLSRSLNEVEYLRIKLRKAPFTILITDQVNPSGFRAFADAFEAQVQGYNKHSPPPLPTQKAVAPILRKKGFYSTVWAKILTGIFVWATLGLIAALCLGEASVSMILRLALVIIPGTGYMVYRVFLKKDR